MVQRFVFAAAAISLTSRQQSVTFVAAGAIVAIWAARGWIRQTVTCVVRTRLTIAIAERAMLDAPDEVYADAGQAHAAIYEGRAAAAKVLTVHVPAIFSETTAALVLLYVVKPMGVPFVVAVVAVACGVVGLTVARRIAGRGIKAAWERYLIVADGTLTAIRAATELVASGSERAYMAKLRADTNEWVASASRAERSAALFERVPLATVVLIAAVVLTRTTIEDSVLHVIRLGVLLPPVAGATRAFAEMLRAGAKLQTLDRALAPHEPVSDAGTVKASSQPREIRFNSVGFAYGHTPVVDEVSFSWKQGQVLALRGPNGSGKSTLLKLALGLLKPRQGTIWVDDVALPQLDVSAWRAGIAYLPQRPFIPEQFTIFEAMQLTNPGLSHAEAEQALARAAVSVQLSHAHTGPPPLHVTLASLSVGMRQRVLLARVFARQRTMILLDEPDENLDSDARALLLKLVRCGGASMVGIATHDAGLLAASDLVVDLTPGGKDAYSSGS